MSIAEGTSADGSRIAEQVVRSIPQIATLPEVAAKVVQLANGSETAAMTLMDVISFDPSFGARILKVANSCFYGMEKSVTSLERAIVVLGNNAIRNIALASSLARLYRIGDAGCRSTSLDLWMHSVAVATGAHLLAAKTKRVCPEEAFLAGLIHDVGIIVEIQARRKSLSRPPYGAHYNSSSCVGAS